MWHSLQILCKHMISCHCSRQFSTPCRWNYLQFPHHIAPASKLLHTLFLWSALPSHTKTLGTIYSQKFYIRSFVLQEAFLKNVGVSRCKLLYIEWINKVLLYSAGNYIQYPVINHNGEEYKKESIYRYTYISLC